MVETLVIGTTIEPDNTTLPATVWGVLPYKADLGRLVHQVYRYSVWIGLDCQQWRCAPFVVLPRTAVITCLWCIAEAVHHGR